MFKKKVQKTVLQLLVFTFVSLSTLSLHAQGTGAEDLDALVNNTKNDLLAVVGGGLAGAVLGLSTLSFVTEPKDHTRNIIVGASIGIIAGVAYVAISQATKTQELIYGGEEGMEGEEVNIQDSKAFNTYARNSWHYENLTPSAPPLLKVQPYLW